MNFDLTSEIEIITTRSGGKGGQNVNKVETAVIAYWKIDSSPSFREDQKKILAEKLANRINSEGALMVRSQVYRTQLENREEAIRRMHELVESALKKKKMRIGTKPSKQSREKRLESKKRSGAIKEGRRKFKPGDF